MQFQERSGVGEALAITATQNLPVMGRGLPTQGPEIQGPTIWHYWRILVKFRWTIITTTVIVTALTALVVFRMTPEYEASGRLAIKSTESDILGFKASQTTDENFDPDRSEVETQVKILESDALAMQAIRKLGMAGKPVDTQTADPMAATVAADKQEEAILAKFHKSLTITSVPRTRIIEMKFVSNDPRLATNVINTLTELYIDQNIRSRFESTTQASSWLARQLNDLQMKVETAQQKLVDYQKQNDIVGLDDKQNITTERLDEINRELTAAEGDRIAKEAQYRIAQSGNAELIAQLAASNSGPQSVLDKLRAQEADLKTQLAQLNTKYGPSYPQVVDVKAQLAQVDSNIKSTVDALSTRMKNDYLAALDREQMLRASLGKQKQEANALNQRAIDYNILKRDAETSRQLYEGLLTKLKEAEVAAGLQSTNIRVVDHARVPVAPARPKKALDITMGLVLGLLGGIVIAFALESLDSTIRSTEEVEAITGLPMLGIIPAGSQPGRMAANSPKLLAEKPAAASIVSVAQPNSHISEAYRALRTSLLLSSVGSPPRIIMVTSPLPQDGKTTTSINIACTFAQRGGKVLLVDADLRKPTVAQRLQMSSAEGLSTLLAGASSEERVVRPVPNIPNLYLLSAGPRSPRPAELLGSDVMANLIREWRSQYDHVIIDTPPVLSVTDAAVLSASVDVVALVVRSAQTPKQALRRTRELLAFVNAKVAGVVINAVHSDASTHYYYHYYGGGYGKYRSYYSEDSA